MIISFGKEIHNNNLSLDDALEQQIRLKDDISILKESTKTKEPAKKENKGLNLKNLKNAIILLNDRQKVLKAFESKIFQNENKEKDLQVF